MRAIIYLRVSTHEQKELGFGLQSQRNMCELEARKRGISKKLVFTDALSGKMSIWDRPGLTDALLNLKKDDVFIVSHRDRLARDPKVMADIEAIIRNSKAQLTFVVDEQAESKNSLLRATIADIIAEHEATIIGSRTKHVLCELKSQNRCIGNVPFGYQLSADHKHIEPCAVEQEIILHAQRLYKRSYSLADIAKEINARGYTSRKGTPFKAVQISRMLNSGNEVLGMRTNLEVVVKSLRLQGCSINQIVNELKKQGFTTKKGTMLLSTQVSRILKKAHIGGAKNSFVPYGFRMAPTGELQECFQEQEIISLAHKLRSENYSFNDIKRSLNSRGYRSRAGKKFHVTQVVRMLEKATQISEEHAIVLPV